ncbi:MULTISPECIES: ABC transporter substrate-binding protein [unclassified Beijerinckia]|uniref:ABC transporter substrate-binding protein n=1 Tax=unclassified Beijerinckia TaxID=2638183 RepID=UPI0008953612|nr:MULTISPECIES: ABC transporter substrate-binding protein [unclassified Beijerinckia]MDH7795970.1 peptide/nickel transport system substrate-binding protein [Beijerinckia sp. GAS462]SEC24342.1 peptide/nickel transport system substrate-binding protein [Beijerinckia sp. 28-YEA-48]
MSKAFAGALLCSTVFLVAAPAEAQKAQDTLRVAYKVPISTTDIYYDPQPEMALTSAAVFDMLVAFDAKTKTLRPSLAESWKQVTPTVIEMKLREGIKFHDGSPFTADDVVYTLTYITDPKSNLRSTALWSFIEKVEKIDDHNVRITTKSPTPYALARLAAATPIFPKAVHSRLENKADFGRRTPIGTGPYKVVSVDASSGIKLVRNDDYKPAGSWNARARIKNVHLLPMPDPQTQIAQLLTGGIDIILESPKDQSEQLTTMPNITSTAVGNTVYTYMLFDAAGRSGVEPLTKPEVRRALAMAVDRPLLAKAIMAGGDMVKVVDAPCSPAAQVGCVATPIKFKHDPKAARDLLAKAGYPNGFDVQITTLTGAEKLGEAIAGQLRAIGVRASMDHTTFVAFRTKQTAGKFQILVAHYSSGGTSDVNSVLQTYLENESRDYWRDKELAKLATASAIEMDPKQRDDLLRQTFDMMNDKTLLLPLTTFPAVLVHTTDLVLPQVSTIFTGPEFNNIAWK